MHPIFSVPLTALFDRNFSELIKSNGIEVAKQKLSEISQDTNSPHHKSVEFFLDVLSHLKLALRLVFEKKLLKRPEVYESLWKKIMAFFEHLHLDNALNTSFVSLNVTFELLSKVPGNPIQLTITIPYLLWFWCQRYQINTRERLMLFLNVINGSYLAHCNSNSSNFDVLTILRSKIKLN